MKLENSIFDWKIDFISEGVGVVLVASCFGGRFLCGNASCMPTGLVLCDRIFVSLGGSFSRTRVDISDGLLGGVGIHAAEAEGLLKVRG